MLKTRNGARHFNREEVSLACLFWMGWRCKWFGLWAEANVGGGVGEIEEQGGGGGASALSEGERVKQRGERGEELGRAEEIGESMYSISFERMYVLFLIIPFIHSRHL
jgi:hypothetical protein